MVQATTGGGVSRKEPWSTIEAPLLSCALRGRDRDSHSSLILGVHTLGAAPPLPALGARKHHQVVHRGKAEILVDSQGPHDFRSRAEI